MFSRLVNTINYNNSRNIFHSVIGVVFSENSKRGNHGSCALRVFIFNHDSPYSYQQRSCVAMSRNEFTEDFGEFISAHRYTAPLLIRVGRIMIEYEYPECTTSVITSLAIFRKHYPNYRVKDIA